MKFYQQTLLKFRDYPELTISKFPLVWLKSDNAGILPDPQRGPRQIYETAFFGHTGGRMVVTPVGNAYSAPTDRSSRIHVSEKPEPMLKHFFKMLVDENTKMLDPTCGSGSALRAAEALGAKYVLGLELDPENAEAANKALEDSRKLRKVSK